MQVVLAPAGPLRLWLERLVAVQAVDRGVALGAQAFSALFPLLIVYSAVVPLTDAKDFAQRIIDRLKLSGDAAQSVRDAVAPPSTVTHGITVLGFVLVVISALSLARALQRLYELSFELPRVVVRGTPWWRETTSGCCCGGVLCGWRPPPCCGAGALSGGACCLAPFWRRSA
jgi:hypothetical protein